VVKVDLTSSGGPLNERLLREYAIKGVPTIVFLGADGRELPTLRLVDYLPADGFLARMQAARVNSDTNRGGNPMLKIRVFLNEPQGKP